MVSHGGTLRLEIGAVAIPSHTKRSYTMLDTTTHTWTAAYKYYTRLSTESQAVFEAIHFDNQDTDLFSWLNSQLSTHNNLLDNPVQFSQWFESTYDFQNIVSSVKEVVAPEIDEPVYTVPEQDVSQEGTVPTEDTTWTRLMSQFETLTEDERYLIMTQLGVLDYNVDTIVFPTGSRCYKTYSRRLKTLRTKLSSI